MIGDTSPLSNRIQEKKETRMFYIANTIKLSVVLDLLWKFTLIVCYKLNIFRPPLVNQFYIHALLFGGYSRFIPLDNLVFNGYWKSLTSGSLSMLNLYLTLFPLCNGLCCSLFNYPLEMISIAPCRYICFNYCLSV